MFLIKKVADYYNSKFINIKVDCEGGEGIDIAKAYQIKVFLRICF